MRRRAAAGAVAALAALAALGLWWALRGREIEPDAPVPGPLAPAPDVEPADAAPPVETSPVAPASADDPTEASPVRLGVSGVVVDAAGATVEGAIVRHGPSTRNTDAAGKFAVRMIAWSATGSGGTLLVSKEGHGTAQVELRRNGPRELRVVLPPASEIAGVVEGPAGPIAGARVVLEDGAWERAVETDARGAFRFPEARTGWCTIVASARDHRPESSRVAPGMARRTLRIRLRAELAEFALRVVDGEGRPVEGAEVEARYEGRDGATVHAITDATGFALALSRNPRVRVSVEADGFAPWGITLPWRLEADYVVTLPREAILEVRAADSMDPGERDAWTFALGSNFVEDSDPQGPDYGPQGDRVGAVYHDDWVRFDAQGRAPFKGVRVGGAYAIVAGRRDRGGGHESFRLIAWKTTSLPAGPTVVEWSSPGLVPVRVRIEDETTGAGIVGLVRFEMDEATHRRWGERIATNSFGTSVRTGTDGAATAWLWPGKYRVTGYGGLGISHEPQATTDLQVPESGAEVTLRLPHGSVLRGRLVDATGTALPGRQVHCYGARREDGFRHMLTDTTDDAGRFEIHHAPDGEYELWVQGIRGEMTRPAPAAVKAPSGGLDLVVTGFTLRGDVRPVPEGPAFVQVAQKGYGPGVEEAVSDTGAFEVHGLCPGPKSIVVRRLGGEFLGTAEVDFVDGVHVTVLCDPPPKPDPR